MNNLNSVSIRISAVTITKNEEKNIGRWLHSVKLYADEIIVVDTGSDDRTVAIAEVAGARVEHFKWINDFAAAKNYALNLCTGQWIAFLDADEYFPDEDAKKVRAILESLSPNRRIVGVFTPLINIDHDNHDKFISRIHQLRLFRNLPDLRYAGHIHESLVGLDIKNRTMTLDESIQIFHTGYSSSIANKKMTRNLAILEAEIARRGHRIGDYGYLADCYYGLEEYEKTIEYATKHIDSGEHTVGDEASTHALRISARYLLDQPIEQILPDIEQGIREFPHSAVFHFLAGNIYHSAKNYITAAHWYADGIKILSVHNSSELDSKTQITGATTGESLLPSVYANWSEILYLSGDYESSIDYSIRGLSIYRYNAKTLGNLLQVLGELSYPAADIIEVLYMIYGVSDADYLCKAVFPFINRFDNLAKIYAYFAKKSNANTSSPLVLLALGNIDSVADETARNLSRSLISGICSSIQQGVPIRENPIRLLVTPSLGLAWSLLEKELPLPDSLSATADVHELLQNLKNYKPQKI
ncbi:MAG: glycosyltransferase [Selenomonadaceae bacterium]|nr:glycosyltransferase [Selenomonadaceae bacterium]